MLTAREQLLRELASYQECQTEIRSVTGRYGTDTMRPSASSAASTVVSLFTLGCAGMISGAVGLRWLLRRLHG